MSLFSEDRYKCVLCENEFNDPYKSIKFGWLWLIAVIFSFGLALLIWLVCLMFRKDICPYCGSHNFVKLRKRG